MRIRNRIMAVAGAVLAITAFTLGAGIGAGKAFAYQTTGSHQVVCPSSVSGGGLCYQSWTQLFTVPGASGDLTSSVTFHYSSTGGSYEIVQTYCGKNNTSRVQKAWTRTLVTDGYNSYFNTTNMDLPVGATYGCGSKPGFFYPKGHDRYMAFDYSNSNSGEFYVSVRLP